MFKFYSTIIYTYIYIYIIDYFLNFWQQVKTSSVSCGKLDCRSKSYYTNYNLCKKNLYKINYALGVFAV